MRERCLNIIATLPLPRPFELEEFRRALSRQRQRTLRFVPAPGARDGLWIAAHASDYIYYPAGVAPLRKLQVVATELGHMLLEHEGTPTATNQIARLLLPSLDPALTVATLRRFRYSPAQHGEAATFAALLLDHMETASTVLSAHHQTAPTHHLVNARWQRTLAQQKTQRLNASTEIDEAHGAIGTPTS